MIRQRHNTEFGLLKSQEQKKIESEMLVQLHPLSQQ